MILDSVVYCVIMMLLGKQQTAAASVEQFAELNLAIH